MQGAVGGRTKAQARKAAGEVDRLADIRAAIDEIEGTVQSTLADLAARTDEFSGAALGSQRVPIDHNIDIEKRRSWLQDQLLKAQEKFIAAANGEVGQIAESERAYYDQLLKSLDAGVSPLTAHSGESDQ